MSNVNTITEIKSFLDGYNDKLKYITNVEADPDKNYADCVIHEPNKEPVITRIPYIPFMHMKDLEANGIKLYQHHGIVDIIGEKIKSYGITITKLETGNQKRLKDGYCYKIESTKSYNSILEFLKDGGVDVFEKSRDGRGQFKKDFSGRYVYKNRDLFSNVRTTEQFFISTKSRLFKGIEEYKGVHRLTFDIETNGLRYNIARVFAIGVYDNRGLDVLLEAEKLEDDEAEKKLIERFFALVVKTKPAVIVGQNSETFDFDFILGRAKILGLDIYKLQTTLKSDIPIKRRPNVSVKYGNQSDKFTATEIWGISVIDTLHAIKRTAAVNSEIKKNDLKYIAKFEKIARPNRTYIKAEGNDIFYFYQRNNIFVCDDNNNYVEIPTIFQELGKKLHLFQQGKIDGKITDEEYSSIKRRVLTGQEEFIEWYRKDALPLGLTKFIDGKTLTRQYLSDDLYETAQVDELYNQSSFMLAKIIPTTYQRVCTMGTAAVWNLLLTAWSYENDVAIPYSEKKEDFSGGMARTYKTGYSKKWTKIDYASLYPMLQLTYGIFPMFDITGVIEKMLLYLTTTRNIYKKLASSDDLDENELTLLMDIDRDTYEKYNNYTLTIEDRAMFKIKQLPIKILNNSLFGALGSGIAFNWSDNICAARITCTGRLYLRYAVNWFTKYKCIPLLAVTDGINFQIPDSTNILVTNEGITEGTTEGTIEEMWQFGGKTGVSALIAKFNAEMKAEGEAKLGSKSYMAVDNDGDFISCLNLSRINYATLSSSKNKKTGEFEEKIKLTGNTIKSKTMPEYIEEFIDKGLKMILHGDGIGFVNYYNEYVEDIYYMRIPLKKIATKMRYKNSIKTYLGRGLDKNGKPKGKQAHMELLIDKREKLAVELFEKYKDGLLYTKADDKLSTDEKIKLLVDYLPPEPEIDSMIYLVNIGSKKGDGNSGKNENDEFNSTIITNKELSDNPNLLGKYNVIRYLEAFNKRVSVLTAGFEPEIAKKIIAKAVTDKKTKRMELVMYMPAPSELALKAFDFNNVEDSMILEPKEVIFWNKTGYDPRLIWDGFKCDDDNPLFVDSYNEILNHLNKKMVDAGKNKIKSINDKYIAGDLVLIKNRFNFMLGQYDGVYIKIIKDIENLPKTTEQLYFEEKEKLRSEEIERLRLANGEDIINISPEMELKIKYFPIFKKAFKKQFDAIGEIKLEELLEMPDAVEVFDEFIKDKENDIDDFEDDDYDY